LLLPPNESKLFNSHFPHTFTLRDGEIVGKFKISVLFFFSKDHLALNKNQQRDWIFFLLKACGRQQQHTESEHMKQTSKQMKKNIKEKFRSFYFLSCYRIIDIRSLN
jgi:hypothetical protein